MAGQNHLRSGSRRVPESLLDSRDHVTGNRTGEPCEPRSHHVVPRWFGLERGPRSRLRPITETLVVAGPHLDVVAGTRLQIRDGGLQRVGRDIHVVRDLGPASRRLVDPIAVVVVVDRRAPVVRLGPLHAQHGGGNSRHFRRLRCLRRLVHVGDRHHDTLLGRALAVPGAAARAHRQLVVVQGIRVLRMLEVGRLPEAQLVGQLAGLLVGHRVKRELVAIGAAGDFVAGHAVLGVAVLRADGADFDHVFFDHELGGAGERRRRVGGHQRLGGLGGLGRLGGAGVDRR